MKDRGVLGGYSLLIAFLAGLVVLAVDSGRLNAKEPDFMKDFRMVHEVGGITDYELRTNGLRVLLGEDHSAPVATVMVTYRVGSRHEIDRYRGAAHLLEHMLFKATEHYDKRTTVSIARALQDVGAILNAGTWPDGTNYYELLPSNHLGLAIAIEADRMRGAKLLAEDLRSEMPVVQSEFDRLENSPLIALEQAVWQKAFQVHPYHFPVIGIRSHLEAMPSEHLREFYNQYYYPNNAVLSVIGDFKREEILSLIHEHFASLPPSPAPIPSLNIHEPEQKEKRSVEVRREDKIEAIYIAHKIPAALHPDIPALDVLSKVLAGSTASRFYRELVDRGLAVQVAAEVEKRHDPSLFVAWMILAPGVQHERMEKAVLDIYERIQSEGISEEELKRARRQLHVESAFARDGSYHLSSELSSWIAAGDWTQFITYPEKTAQVTAEDVARVARKYLRPDSLTTGYLISKNPEPALTRPTAKAEKPAPDPKPGLGHEEKTVEPDEFPVDVLDKETDEISKIGNIPLSKRVQTREVAGFKVMSVKTAVKDVVTLTGSITSAGYAYADNPLVPSLLPAMLSQGTQKRDKREIARLLSNHGIQLTFHIDYERFRFDIRCLRQDIGLALALTAEQLRYPLLPEEEFPIQVQQHRVDILEAMSNTSRQAQAALSRLIYPHEHPHYELPFEDQLRLLDQVTVSDLRRFHESHFGPQGGIIVAVGDIDPQEIEKGIRKGFEGWVPHQREIPYRTTVTWKGPPSKKVIRIPDKVQIDVFLGHALPLRHTDKDFLPAFLGNFILGGNFSSRLSNSVRDEKGLTYHIHSELSGIEREVQGHWQITMILNPHSLEPGLEATLHEIRAFAEKGVSEQELAEKKETVIGNFKVSLSTTRNMAYQILKAEELGLGIAYLDEFPQKIHAVTLEEVNAAIARYFHPEQLHIAIAGVAEKSEPLAPQVPAPERGR